MSLDVQRLMVTAAANLEYAILERLGRLSDLPGVVSVHTRWIENAFNVWIGVSDEDENRDLVYAFEDSFLNEFNDMTTDFHVVTIPAGRRIEEFVSDARTVYQRIS